MHAAPNQDPQRVLSDLAVKLDAINEQYNTAVVQLRTSRGRQVTLKTQIKTQQVKVNAYEAKVGAIAAAAYKGGRTGMLTTLLTGGNAQNALDQIAALEHVTLDQKRSIDRLVEAKKPLDEAKKKLDTEIAKQAAQEKILRERKTTLNREYAIWKTKVASLPRPSNGGTSSTPVVYDGNAQGRARIVVKFAYAQLGKSYVFGADGPGTFDCSGLTLAAWAKVGVSLPHSSRAQLAQIAKVGRSAIQPGDLVFFYDDRHHVGIAIDNSRVIHAPTTGDVVKITSISAMPFSGAGRPG